MLSRMLWLILCIMIIWAIAMFFFWGDRLEKNPYKAAPNTIALTFDDGPTLPFTPKILKTLKKNNIHATFFVLGKNAKKHPELIKALYRAGNAIACHGVTHINLTRASKTQLAAEVQGCKKTIRDILGKTPICFRPAYNKFTKRETKYIESQNMVVIPVGIDSSDWRGVDAQTIVDTTLKLVKPKSVITLHDGSSVYENRSQTVKALPIIIKKIRHMGLGFSRICYP